MKSLVLKLEEVGPATVNLAGGKGANLGEMVRQGFPVPPGFVVSAKACADFFRQIDLEGVLTGSGDLSLEKLEVRCRTVRGIIEQQSFPDDLADSIRAILVSMWPDRLETIKLAVRSSALSEDSGAASFAGQHATYYYVTEKNLLTMIKHCWASLFTPQAIAYRAAQGRSDSLVYMAVVVQEMVHSRISGVTFTANPVTGARDEIVVESSWGMGAAIVDGRVTPDHYVLDRQSLSVKEKRIARKDYLVPAFILEGQTVRLQEVPRHLSFKETLSLDQAREVARWAIKAEECFHAPQDVEWAFDQGRFFMLQSRPITVTGRPDITAGVKGKWVLFKPLVENFTHPTTPLTANFATILFSPPLFKNLKGWLYVNLDLVRAILPYRFTDEEMIQFLYRFEVSPPRGRFSWLKLGGFLIFTTWLLLTFGVLFLRTENKPAGFMDRFRHLARRIEQAPEYGPVEALEKLFFWNRILQPVGEMVLWVNLTAGRYMVFFDLLHKLLKRYLPSWPEDSVSLLSSGSEGVFSADMGRDIVKLAREAGNIPVIREILMNNPPNAAWPLLQAEPKAATFLAEISAFLDKYGHRGLKEVELASPRWDEDPAPVMGMIRNCFLTEIDPQAQDRSSNQARDYLKQRLRSALESYPLEKTFRPRWRVINFLANKIKEFARMRENSRFYHIMGFQVLRKKILRLEKDLMAQGRLKCPGDIFFLHWSELEKLQSGSLEWLDVEEIIRHRRLEMVRLTKMGPPKYIGVELEPGPKQAPNGEEHQVTLHGQSASPGKYLGTARVILDPGIDLELQPGEILIAPYTDPAWTPLFLTAGAAVVEVGSYLSHAGTVAREFGLPCVVDVPDCTKLIHSGHMVEVDGDTGLVRLVAPREGNQPT